MKKVRALLSRPQQQSQQPTVPDIHESVLSKMKGKEQLTMGSRGVVAAGAQYYCMSGGSVNVEVYWSRNGALAAVYAHTDRTQ